MVQGKVAWAQQTPNPTARELARELVPPLPVRYINSLTVGVKKKKTIAKCDMAHVLTSRTFGEKQWRSVGGDCEESLGIQSEGDLCALGLGS